MSDAMSDVAAATLEEISPGAMKSVMLSGTRVVIFRTSDGALYALEDRCSHAEVWLSSGKFRGCEVTCPAHGARFDVRSGKVLCMPAIRDVRAFPIRVENGEIIVTLP